MLLRQRLLAHHADPGRTQLKVPPTQPLARTWADAARLTAVYSLSVRLGLSRKAAGGRKRPHWSSLILRHTSRPGPRNATTSVAKGLSRGEQHRARPTTTA